MANKITLDARGLYTDPNLISKVPSGALVIADNVVIDRDSVIEPRRGFGQYGNLFGIGTDRAKQLLTYKSRLLVHYKDKLLFNNNPHNLTQDGDFQEFDGSYEETEPGLRIKYLESNRNLYFTTNEGIKKISAKSAADFTTSPGYILNAGAIKALDVSGKLNRFTSGFLPAKSKVAYRIVWGYRDNNDVLLLGAPSARTVITNFSDQSANVDLEFVIPNGITDSYFYQVYRTAVFQSTSSLTVDEIDPGDEMNLVIEGFPTSAQKLAKLVNVTDLSPEDFRQGGVFLYTNPNSGEGIQQANEIPPKAKDLAAYQNTIFYANTTSKASTTISLLGVENLVSGVSSISIDDGVNPAQTYTFVGDKEKTKVDFTAYTGSIPLDVDGKYWLLNSSSNIRKYYIWYDNTKTSQTLDFSNYIGTIPSELDGKYIVIFTPGIRSYYIWFDATGTTVDPGNDPNNLDLVSRISVKVDITSALTKADVASAVSSALTTNNIFDDYDVVYVALSEDLTIETESFNIDDIIPIETVLKGFTYTITTPPNLDPAANTDNESRIGIKVNISRNVNTTADLADATAAAIFSADEAGDFEVTYNNGDSFLVIENKNNGNTDDAADSLIDGLNNGFSITVLNQGDGEDALTGDVLLSAAATPAQRIDETARSLVNIINRNSSDVINAIYISGPTDLPGQILLEARDISTSSFTVTANDGDTGSSFNPPIPPATGAAPVVAREDVRPNRLFFSKIQQPEAVPSVNFIDIGPQDKEISRILALRESLFILKEDGIYRLTGVSGSFGVDLFDESTKIIAPDSAVVLNNQIFCLTNQGIARISDTGVDIVSKRLDNIFKLITSSNYNFRLTSFGVSYETDRSYILWVPSSTADNVATQAFRYNTADDVFTRWPIAKTCGLVNSSDNKLYLGPSDKNFIERERKVFNRTDYADRQFELSIPSNSVNGSSVVLSQSNIATIGDAIVQKQFLTINQYNQLLKKLDLDPFTGAPEQFTIDFSNYSGSIPNDLHGKYFLVNSASNAERYALVYDAFNNLSSLNPQIFTDLIGVTQIRADISSITTLTDLANITQNTLKTATQDFVVSYITGQEIFTASTVRNGETDNPTDSSISGLGNGFSITVTQEGFGDYFSSLGALPGDNLRDKVTQLASKLDNDPSVNDTDYLASIIGYGASFEDTQNAFNEIVDKLNLDEGTFFSNYLQSEGSSEFETLIFESQLNNPTIKTQFSLNFIEGSVTIYKGINAVVQYAPETFGDPSIMKQVREGTVMFENSTFTRGEVGYKTDLSPGVEVINFNKSGNGDWGTFIWSNQNWGGGFSGVPFRTYIPRSKQRCRYIQAQYTHTSAREKWAIFGISYTLRAISERAYKGN